MRQARVATAATFAAQGLMFTVLLTHLPQFTDRYRISNGAVTLIVFLVTVLAGGGSLLSELLATRRSSGTALRYGLLVVVLAGALIGVAPRLAVFVLGFAVYGVGAGMVDAAGNMQAVGVQHRYGRSIIASFHAAWSGAAIVGALYVAGGERIGVPLAGSILPVAGVVLVVLLVAGPRLLAQVETPAQVENPSQESTGTGTGTGTGTAGEDSATGGRSLSPARGALLALGLAMTCFWAVDSGVSNWSALYLRDLLHASDSTAALGFACYQAMGLVSRLSGDPMVRRFGAVVTVRGAATLGTAGTLLVVLAPGPIVAIAGFGLAGLGLPVIAPLCFSAAGAAVRAVTSSPSSLSPGHDIAGRATADATVESAVDSAVARLNVFNYFGSLLGAVLIGAIATATNLRAGFVVSVLLSLALLALAGAFAVGA